MARLLVNRAGSVLPVVFIFAVIAVITVSAFVSGQYMLARPVLTVPVEIQALLNARSGIWKGLEMLSQPKKIDTLKTINTLDSAFNSALFGKMTEAIKPDKDPLSADEDPLSVQPYSSDSFGTCEIALKYRGCYELLESKGSFRNRSKNVTVKFGGIFSGFLDTVLFLSNNPLLQTPVRGKIHYGPFDTAGTVRTDDLTKFLSYVQGEMSDSLDTMKPAPPRLIQHNVEFDTVPETVRGPLLIDGSHFDLTWKVKKRIVVLGDVQITGKTSLEGMDFLATGAIKVFDDAHLRDVFLFSPQTISMGDRAVFSGTAMTLSNILVSGAAAVENRSMLVAVKKAAAPAPAPKPADRGKKKHAVFSITFSESSTIDATVVSQGDSLGIKIDRNAVVKGMLRSQGAMCLDGKVYGVIHAKNFVDGPLAVSGKSTAAISVIHGALLPLEDRELRNYYFPFFMGKSSIIEWVEE